MATVLGSETGTENSKFKVGLYYSISYGTSTWTIKYKVGISVTEGNFQGSFIQYSGAQYNNNDDGWTSVGWSPSGSTLDSTGLYCVSDEKTQTASYGENIKIRVKAGYTGKSGTVYRSYLTATFKAVKAYDTYTYNNNIYNGGWKSGIPYVYINGWRQAFPYVYINGAWKPTFTTTSHANNAGLSTSTSSW
jgi:hypothetical protein